MKAARVRTRFWLARYGTFLASIGIKHSWWDGASEVMAHVDVCSMLSTFSCAFMVEGRVIAVLFFFFVKKDVLAVHAPETRDVEGCEITLSMLTFQF